MRIKEAHLNRGLVALPPGSKINAHNGVLLPLTASPVLKAQNKTELRTVKIGYYDAESKYMYPILENYRAYVKPGYTVPDGVEPVTLESPSPVSPIYKLEEDKSVSANAEQIRADIAEARENGTEVDVPDYAYISPKGIISMYEYDSPYEEYRHREGITRIGFYDEETGKMLVLDDWRCPYSDFVDKTYESKREKRRKEKAREESIEVDIPDYARITVSDYWYRNGFSCVVIREKDSPYPEYRDSDLYVRIGKYNEETMRMHPEPNYYRYLNREAAVDYPSNRYMPSEDGLVPVPPFAKLWKTGVYCIQRNMSPNRIITTLGGSLKVGLPSEHEGMMVPLPDYEAACIENAPVREEMIHVSEQTFGQMLEEKRQKELTIFDDRECYVYPG